MITGRTIRRGLAVASVVLMTSAVVRADTVFWDAGGDGVSWHDPFNWGTDTVPTAADDVFITLGGTYTVTTGAAANAATLTIGNASGAQELEVTGGMLTVAGNVDIDTNATLTARGDLSVAGLLDVAVDGALIIENTSDCCEIVIDVTSGVTNSGMIQLTSTMAQGATLNVTGGSITNNNGGTIDLLVGAGGSRTLGADVDNSGAINFNVTTDVGGSLTNTAAGRIQVDSIDLCCEVVPTINGDLLNSGLLQITSSVAGDSGIGVTGGAIINNSGGTIDLLVGAGGTRTLSADVEQQRRSERAGGGGAGRRI